MTTKRLVNELPEAITKILNHYDIDPNTVRSVSTTDITATHRPKWVTIEIYDDPLSTTTHEITIINQPT